MAITSRPDRRRPRCGQPAGADAQRRAEDPSRRASSSSAAFASRGSAASRSFVSAARSVPRRRPACASTRHAFASARVPEPLGRRPLVARAPHDRAVARRARIPAAGRTATAALRTHLDSVLTPLRAHLVPPHLRRGGGALDPRRLQAKSRCGELWGSPGRFQTAFNGLPRSARADAGRPMRRENSLESSGEAIHEAAMESNHPSGGLLCSALPVLKTHPIRL